MSNDDNVLYLQESMSVQLVNGEWTYLNEDILSEFKEELEKKVIDYEGNSISAQSTLIDTSKETKMYVQMLFKAMYKTDIIDYMYFQGARCRVYGGEPK